LALILPLWLATVFATARTAYHYSTQKRVRELTSLADRLAALVEELVSDRPASRNPERLPP
jgi:phosphopantetheine adenylyltransferase